MSRHGFTFSKALGQNFIVNPGICPKIAEMGGANENTGAIEIGTGVGVLTAELAKRAKKVVAIELDSRLIPVLEETLSEFSNITIINQDVLKTDLHAVIAEYFAGMDVVVCANLPYYITSPILMNLLESRLPVKSITVMVQKEAAARICAMPATREVGAVSIAVRYYSEPKILFPVSRGSFMPAPDVDSCVIKLDVLDTPAVNPIDEKFFFKVVRGAFSQRRKNILNCLSSSLSLSKQQIQSACENCGIPSNARAEQLTMEQFKSLSDEIFKSIN